MPERWYVLHSKPRKENLLWEQLRLREIEAFHPQLRVQPVNPRARKVRSYFPGYVFVRVDLDQVNWSTLQWMPGATGLVSFGGEPASVPESLIQAIRHRVEEINASGGEQLMELKQGDPVVIQGGAFDGYEAIFDAKVSGNERVRVLLTFLKAQQKWLDLPAAQIKKKKR
jgi:transcription elongation factor/antiterminator RfaH